MSRWYARVTRDANDLSPVADAYDYFEAQYLEAQKEISPKGRIWDMSKLLPGLVEQRYGQLQEIEAILRYLEIRYDKTKADKYRFYLENYPKTLTSRDADRYAEADPDVIDLALLRNQVGLIRNKFISLTKAMEYLHFQIGHMVALRKAGIEDASF
jgi:hypothetical protein